MCGKKIIHTFVLVFAFLAILLVFTSGKSRTESAVSYTILEAGTDAAFSARGPALSIIADKRKYENFYAGLHINRIPATEAPAVDFNDNFVVYISYGQKNTGGYSIDVLGVHIARDTLVIRAQLRQPLPDSFQIQVLTHPYVLLVVSRGEYRRVDLVDERGDRLDSITLE